MGNILDVFYRQSEEQVTAANAFVAEAIRSHKVVTFSKWHCPYCIKANRALGTVLAPDQFTIVELNGRPDRIAIQDALLALTGGRTVPRVFVDGAFIGGGDDTARMAANGELKALLMAKGVL